jgi:3',5'-cyclic AMP phosphodiesterase CpdA
MADMQLGAYASFSGYSEDDAARFAAELDMVVEAAPEVEGFEWDAHRYEEAVRAVNEIRPDLVVVGGDMLDDPCNMEQYGEFMRITRLMNGDLPVRFLPGNHDIAEDTVVPRPTCIARYRELFGPDYYAFDQGPLRFVVLNTVVIDHPEGTFGEWEAQAAFLATELAEAEERGRPVVLLGHHPLFKHHPEEEDDYWNLPLERRRIVLDLIRRHGVRIGFAGHWHRNSVGRAGDFEMVTTGPVGYPLGRDPSGFTIVDYADGRFSHSYRLLGGQGPSRTGGDAGHPAQPTPP